MPVLLRTLLLGGIVATAAGLSAQDAPATGAAQTRTAAAADEPVSGILSPEEKEKRRKAQIALSGVAAIAILGVAGLAAVVLWGGRLRRMLRNSPGPKPLKNELWFLKPEKPPVRPNLPERNDAPPKTNQAEDSP